MNKITSFLIGCVFGFVFAFIFAKCNRQQNPSIKTDTISVTEYKTFRDTVIVNKPQYYKEIVRDTVPIREFTQNEKIVITQKEYRDSNYIAWVSGVEPQLDSIMVFNNTEYVFKTSTIETIKTIEDKTGKWLAGAGIYRLDNALIPKLNIVYQKKRIMVGASVGLYNKQPMYGIDVNLKFK